MPFQMPLTQITNPRHKDSILQLRMWRKKSYVSVSDSVSVSGSLCTLFLSLYLSLAVYVQCSRLSICLGLCPTLSFSAARTDRSSLTKKIKIAKQWKIIFPPTAYAGSFSRFNGSMANGFSKVNSDNVNIGLRATLGRLSRPKFKMYTTYNQFINGL